ncbi:MAG: ABC transporter substrate-binding protein [Gemmatimonadetes bacterium]|nr:ABC transporter substrate-binding protein [Gemmatimonadota bacterium]
MAARGPGLAGSCIPLATAVLFLSACGGPADSPPLREVPRERTLVVMNGGPHQYSLYDNHNPYLPGSDQGFHFGTLPAVFEPLIMFNVLTGEHENWLAESWEYDEDYKAIALRLREGIRWSDGRPLTAADVAFTMRMLLDNADSMVHHADLAEFLEEAQVLDELTVRLLLTRTAPGFWASTLSTNHGIHVLPAHIWRDQDPLEFSNYDIARGWPVGTGPFRLVYASTHQKIYDRRDDWWGAETGFRPLPEVERVMFVPSQEESQAAQMLLTDQVDMGQIMQVSTLRAVMERNPKVITYSGRSPPYGYMDWCPVELGLNCSEPPFDDPDIRWALSLAIDRERLVDLAESGAGMVTVHPFTPYKWLEPLDRSLREMFARYGCDTRAHPERVAQIMEGKGYRRDEEGFWIDAEGERMALNIYIHHVLKPYGPPLVQQLRDAGFDATFDTSPGLGSLTQTGELPIALGCRGPSGVRGMDPYFMLSIYTSRYFRPTGKPAPLWWATSRWRNEEYDRIVERVQPLHVDDAELMPLVREAMEIWVREMPDIYLSLLIIRYPMNTSRWVGWPTEDSPYGFPHSWQWEFLKTLLRLRPADSPEAAG